LRPLPDLSDIPPVGSVFDPAADDFSQLLADQPQSHDQLQALLDPAADQALSDIAVLSDAIDALGTFSDAVDQTFTYIHNSAEEVDYAQKITSVIIQELAFYAGLNAPSPDIAALAVSIQLYVDNAVAIGISQAENYSDQQDQFVLQEALNADRDILAGAGGPGAGSSLG